MIALKKLIAT